MNPTPGSTRSLPAGEPSDRGVRLAALGLLAASACFTILGFRAAAVVLLPRLLGGF
jgi:hypothetical protein